MGKRQFKRILTLLSLFLFTTLFYQNCGKPGLNAVTNQNTDSQSQSQTKAITFNELSNKVFTPICSSCHSGGLEFGGLSVESYARVMEFVVPQHPEQSRLYLRTLTSTTFTMTNEERQMIYDWILLGAKNN